MNSIRRFAGVNEVPEIPWSTTFSAPPHPTESCATGFHGECRGWCSCPCHKGAPGETSIDDGDLLRLVPDASPLAGLMAGLDDIPLPSNPNFDWVEDGLTPRHPGPDDPDFGCGPRYHELVYLPARDFAGPVPIEDGTDARAAENGMGC